MPHWIMQPCIDAFDLVHRLHGTVRILQGASRFHCSPEDALFGNGLYMAMRQQEPVRIAAQAVLVVKRALHTIEMIDRIERAFKTLLRFTTALPVASRVIRERLMVHFASQDIRYIFIKQCPKAIFDLVYRITVVTKKVLLLVGEVLAAGCALLTLIEATVPDEITNFEGITGLVSNVRDIYAAFERRAPNLYRGMLSHKAIIDRIFRHTGFPLTCDDILNGADIIITPLTQTNQVVNSLFEQIRTYLAIGLERVFHWKVNGLQPAALRPLSPVVI